MTVQEDYRCEYIYIVAKYRYCHLYFQLTVSVLVFSIYLVCVIYHRFPLRRNIQCKKNPVGVTCIKHNSVVSQRAAFMFGSLLFALAHFSSV